MTAEDASMESEEIYPLDATVNYLIELLKQQRQHQLLLSKAEHFFRQAERELGYDQPSRENLKKAFSEIASIENQLNDSSDLRDLVYNRRLLLEEEAKQRLSAIKPLVRLEGNRAKIELPETIEQGKEIEVAVSLLSPLPEDAFFALVAWPDSRLYAPDIAIVLAEAEIKDFIAVPDSQSVQWKSSLLVQLEPSSYRLALLQDNRLLPGRTKIQVKSPEKAETHGQVGEPAGPEEESTAKCRGPRLTTMWTTVKAVSSAVVPIVIAIALVVIAVGLFLPDPPTDVQTFIVLTPTPMTPPQPTVPAVRPVADTEARFFEQSLVITETEDITLEAELLTSMETTLPEGGYFFAIGPVGQLPGNSHFFVAAERSDQGRAIRAEIEHVDLAPGRYWVTVMLGNSYIVGAPLELEVQALPVDRLISIEGSNVEGGVQIGSQYLVPPSQTVTVTIYLNSLFTRHLGGSLLVVEENMALAALTDDLVLLQGSQQLRGRLEFTELGSHSEMKVVWRPANGGIWYQLGETLPALRVAVLAIVSDEGGNVRQGPNTQSQEVGFLEAGSWVELIGKTEDGVWLKVISAEGEGWMSTRVLEYEQELLSLLPVVEQ